AEIARERGLGPLAETILADRRSVPSELAQTFLSAEVPDVKTALDGARDILVETFSENADLVGRLRNHMKDKAVLRAKVADGKQEAGAKFSDYFNHFERWATITSHRALAMLRGRNEDVLSLEIEV
ncbi:RNA-binding transcriptional accessory protein, partial [Escherichia coli]|nr:RNA-binding transcriptional accessory protein [Escherichia coli]